MKATLTSQIRPDEVAATHHARHPRDQEQEH
jgi:hypothetical protein